MNKCPAPDIRPDKNLFSEDGFPSRSPAKPSLGLWDAVSIILGIVIGAGIYETAPIVFQNVPNPSAGLLLWAAGGALSLIGALCYAELASTYPFSGGDYIYLTRAYGRWAGFLFGWAQLIVIITGSIGMLGFIFADYAINLTGNNFLPESTYAVFAVVILSLGNIIGVKVGRRTQNFLTTLTVLGLSAIVGTGTFSLFSNSAPSIHLSSRASDMPEYSSFGLALILILYTYGGWNDAAFVVSEVKNKRTAIPRALIIGTLLVAFIYLLVNLSYLLGLGFDGVRTSRTVAADLMEQFFGSFGSSFISLLVVISALASINGLIFTGSRIYSALGKDHSALSLLSQWNSQSKSPVWSISLQALISVALIFIVGTETGRNFTNSLFAWNGGANWKGRGGFDALMQCTAPIFWLFFLLTSLSIFILRKKDKDIPRPFRVPFYPILPMIFTLTCLYMLYSSVVYAGKLLVLTALPLLLGLCVYVAQSQVKRGKAKSSI